MTSSKIDVPVTERENDVYKYISNHLEKHNIPPSLREIGQALGIKSPTTVSACIKSLTAKGLIERIPKACRGIYPIQAKEVSIPLYEDKTMSLIGYIKLQGELPGVSDIGAQTIALAGGSKEGVVIKFKPPITT